MTKEELQDIIKDADSEEQRLRFVQKHLFHGLPQVFNGNEEGYFDFRNKIAEKFQISFHEVFIVGSAKLGYSYFKNTYFDYDSDIDVVIVNEKLFDRFFYQIADYQYQLDRAYKTIDIREQKMYNQFLQYLVKGWMRPDKLPTSFQIEVLKTEWFEYFATLSYGRSEVGNYKVAAGLFKNYDFLSKYYTRTVEDARDKLKTQ